MSEYAETFEGVCPSCGAEVPGHVYVLQPAGVAGWTCPVCDVTSDPVEVSER